ncbi:hypothetical protein [Natrinema sp. DC36]|uniref:hypothetical protein n=1 Tax=Natrinema sp. DC36 TaxID=2878680 RepID=UPI001CF0A669|nr:hypothetical protein [Natrinema sp. DC36]
MTGTKSVIPVSDGLRLILAGGRVVRLKLEDNDTGEELIERQTGSGESVFVGEDATVSLGLWDDPEAADVPAVADSLEHFGYEGHLAPVDGKSDADTEAIAHSLIETMMGRALAVDDDPGEGRPRSFEHAARLLIPTEYSGHISDAYEQAMGDRGDGSENTGGGAA